MFNNNNVDNNSFRYFKKIKDINYFNFDYKNINNAFIVTFDKYVFYRNIYVFVNRLKNLIKSIMSNVVNCIRELISFYFCNEIFI